MDRFVIFLYSEVKKKKIVSRLFCSSLNTALYYLGMFKRKREISFIVLIDTTKELVDLKKGDNLIPFLDSIKESFPNWKAGKVE